MDYTIKAIPTLYRDVMFRSRLEATWAAYFDLVGVAWEYEPFDLEGWAPDFLLRVGGFEILAEVKPVDGDGNDFKPGGPFDKARKHGDDHWVCLLGYSPGVYTIGCLCDQPGDAGGLDTWMDVHEIIHPVGSSKIWKKASNLTRWKGPKA